MSESSLCINAVLPQEILQNILFLSAKSFTDALHISSVCSLWRKLLFNTFIIEHYWKFDNEHRKEGLVHWWNFNGNMNDEKNLFIGFPIMDCFLGKCASLAHQEKNSTEANTENSQYTIDRGSDYTIAFWVSISDLDKEIYCIFMVSDDDYDYTRSAGVAIDEDKFFGIAFASTISGRVEKSNIPVKPNEWFHIVLVQKRQSDERVPQQYLWINGKLELTVDVPIAAYSNSADISFRLWHEWNRSVADISIWSRPLLPIEIRAIYEQKLSIDKVNIAKYIFDHLKN